MTWPAGKDSDESAQGWLRGTRTRARTDNAWTPSLAIIVVEHFIEHQEAGSRGAFHIQQDGKRLAEMTYSRANASLVIIDHTDVDASLHGQGVGRKLLDALVQWARETGTKVVALCPFAKAQFDKDPSIRDVLT